MTELIKEMEKQILEEVQRPDARKEDSDPAASKAAEKEEIFSGNKAKQE